MSQLVETTRTFFFSSDENLGAVNKDLKGSRFQVRLNTPLSVPPTAIDVAIECIAANIWYVSPNIAEEYGNNRLHLVYYSTPLNLTPITITIPDGLYGTDTLNAVVQRQIATFQIPDGTSNFVPTSIALFENPATQRVVISLSNKLGFDANPIPGPGKNNIAETLGFTNSFTASYTGETFEADEVAKFNRINSYLLHTDLVQDGISINSQYDSILTEVQLNARPGDLLAYRPFIPYRVSGKHLKYGNKDFLTFYLTDEQNRPVDTFGENYSFTIIVKYKIREHTSMLGINVPHLN